MPAAVALSLCAKTSPPITLERIFSHSVSHVKRNVPTGKLVNRQCAVCRTAQMFHPSGTPALPGNLQWALQKRANSLNGKGPTDGDESLAAKFCLLYKTTIRCGKRCRQPMSPSDIEERSCRNYSAFSALIAPYHGSTTVHRQLRHYDRILPNSSGRSFSGRTIREPKASAEIRSPPGRSQECTQDNPVHVPLTDFPSASLRPTRFPKCGHSSPHFLQFNLPPGTSSQAGTAGPGKLPRLLLKLQTTGAEHPGTVQCSLLPSGSGGNRENYKR